MPSHAPAPAVRKHLAEILLDRIGAGRVRHCRISRARSHGDRVVNDRETLLDLTRVVAEHDADRTRADVAELRAALVALIASLPRCPHCGKPGTYAVGCDDHPFGEELRIAGALRTARRVLA